MIGRPLLKVKATYMFETINNAKSILHIIKSGSFFIGFIAQWKKVRCLLFNFSFCCRCYCRRRRCCCCLLCCLLAFESSVWFVGWLIYLFTWFCLFVCLFACSLSCLFACLFVHSTKEIGGVIMHQSTDP